MSGLSDLVGLNVEITMQESTHHYDVLAVDATAGFIKLRQQHHDPRYPREAKWVSLRHISSITVTETP